MAEEERKTKAERRAEARAERKRKEEEAAQAQKRASIRNAVIAVAVVAVIALVSVPALSNLIGGDGEGVVVSQAQALEARESAECEMVVENEPLESREHLDPQTAPPADALYSASPVRPTTSGPHFQNQSGAVSGVPNQPLDERQLTHNMEHGALVVWFDPEQVDESTVADMEQWLQSRLDMGYQSQAGGNVFVSPYSGQMSAPIAMRMWGFALDCQEWNSTVADSMLIDYYGTHGFAPERNLSPYPDGALTYGSDDGSEAPSEPSSGTGASSEPSAGESGTGGASETDDATES